MLKHKRLVSIIATIAFCLSFLAPALIAPAPAVAASTYTVLRTDTVANVGDTITQAKFQIDIPNVGALAPTDVLTISLPTDVVMPSAGTAASPRVAFTSALLGASHSTYGALPVVATGAPDILVEAPATLDKTTDLNALDDTAGGNGTSWLAYSVGNSTLDIRIESSIAAAGAGRLIVYFNNVDVNTTFDGDIEVSIGAPSNTGFSSGKVAISKFIGTNTGTYSVAKSVSSMGSGTCNLDTLVLQETIKNSIKNGEVIKYKLPPGFEWTVAGAANGFWDFATRGVTFATFIPADKRILEVTATVPGAPAAAGEGRIYTAGTQIQVVDEGVAKKGEVTVHVSSNLGNVTEQDIVVANYKDYSAVATAKVVKDVVAGEYETELGTINIKEGLKASLLPNRTVTITLPSGVKWDAEYYTPASCFTKKVISGTDWVAAAAKSFDSSYRKLTLTVAAATGSAADIDLEKLKVVISPDFTGDLNVVVAGTAGIDEATLKVANVKAPVEMKADAIKNVVIGTQAQVISDVTITEGLKEAIEASGARNTIAFELPTGVTFTALPTVAVTEGDVVIDSVDFGATKRVVLVEFKSTSSTPSTIKLSNMKVTVDRTVPEGDLKLAIDAALSNALQNACTDPVVAAPDLSFNTDNIASVVVANVITPAPGEQGRNASFYIGSTIMNVNGSNIIMDAAPYVKAGRTYVPVRYLGDALGAETAWDADTKTVTVTKGDKAVVLVIGSKTAKVNGADVAMDVAPEITGGRTMLPARYVAEGLGYAVGWNAVLQQVVIQ